MNRTTALLMDFLNTDEKKNRRLVHLPLGRFGEAIEVARGALFRTSHLFLLCEVKIAESVCGAVASDDSSYVTVSHATRGFYVERG